MGEERMRGKKPITTRFNFDAQKALKRENNGKNSAVFFFVAWPLLLHNGQISNVGLQLSFQI